MVKRAQRIREWLFYQLLAPVRYVFEQWMTRKKIVLIYCIMGNGIGDALAISTILDYLNKKDGVRGIVFSMHPELFLHNPQVIKNISYKSMPSFRRSLFKSLLRCLRGKSVICFGGEVWTLGTSPFSREHLDSKRAKGWVWLQHLMPDHRFNITTLTAKPAIFFGQDELNVFGKKYAGLPKEYAILKASVGKGRPKGSYLKDWFPERFALVIAASQKVQWVQLGESDEDAISGALDLRGKTSLREAMYLVSNAKVFLGVEGFLTHVAAAFQIPAVIPFTGVYDPSAFIYESTIPVIADPQPVCSPCWKEVCDVSGMPCRSRITVDMVYKAVESALE